MAPDANFAEGLTLGQSLLWKTKYSRILLYTEEVPARYLSSLKEFWELLSVDWQ